MPLAKACAEKVDGLVVTKQKSTVALTHPDVKPMKVAVLSGSLRTLLPSSSGDCR